MKTAVLTISTAVSRGEREDTGGALLAELAGEAGAEVVAAEVIPDDATVIEERLRRYAAEGCTFVFTTGGTGFTPDDVTPEATRAVIERPAPGFAEAMRAKSLEYTPMGILTRGESGIVGRTLIVNFPGSPKAVRQLFPVIAPTLEHVAATLHRNAGEPTPGH